METSVLTWSIYTECGRRRTLQSRVRHVCAPSSTCASSVYPKGLQQLVSGVSAWRGLEAPCALSWSTATWVHFNILNDRLWWEAMSGALPPFLALPDAVCDEVLLCLGPNSFSSLALVCKQLRDAVHRDSLWVQLCERKWGSTTEVHSWRASVPGSIFSGRARISPADFRSGSLSVLSLEQGPLAPATKRAALKGRTHSQGGTLSARPGHRPDRPLEGRHWERLKAQPAACFPLAGQLYQRRLAIL